MAIGMAMAGVTRAQTNVPAGEHNLSEQWTLAGSPYRLKGQVYFTSGTTLTIDAGVVVASLPVDQGSLAICRGADIFVNGTQSNPVIMTSTSDVATWVGGDPKTGSWREGANEWGNLTLMGTAYISEDAAALGNMPVPDAGNEGDMEGLQNGASTDRYGGGNDSDDSGTITYLSIRYGGKVIGLANELNGLSLGGIGRDTDIHHVEIMNNIDDGIEIWGGTVNLKYFSIWNVGDDSFDVDQGWRGQAQFGLIVQGYSVNGLQGSGVGDNCFETDGAENSFWQPVTTTQIYNCTIIGQPKDGDHATAWRDNARVQYRNCVFMDIGERVVSFDNVDGDGGSGYGAIGGTPPTATLSWPNTWTTNYNAVPAHPNDFTTGSYATNYPAQSGGSLGKLAEITDSVFFRNLHASAYTEATARGVLPVSGTNNNVLIAGSNPIDAPIVYIDRGPQVVKGGKLMEPVVALDPRPANAALVSVAAAPSNGFYTPAMYRGAFEPSPTATWLADWTASTAFGLTPPVVPSVSPVNYCTAGTTTNNCVPAIYGFGTPSASENSGFTILITGVEGQKQGLLFYGITGPLASPWGAGSSFLCVNAPNQRTAAQSSLGTVGVCDGELYLDWNNYIATHLGSLGTPFAGGETVHAQGWFRDPPAQKTTNLSAGLEFEVDP